MGTLYAQVERLVRQASHQADASISLYYFNAALYLLRVLKGNAASKPVPKTPKKEKASSKPSGSEVSSPAQEGLANSTHRQRAGSTCPFHRSGVEATPPRGPAVSLLEAARALPRTRHRVPSMTQVLSHVTQAAGGLDLSLVTPIYSSALTSFLTKRNSPLTVPMFLSLFSRHPVSIGVGPPRGPCLAQAAPRHPLTASVGAL